MKTHKEILDLMMRVKREADVKREYFEEELRAWWLAKIAPIQEQCSHNHGLDTMYGGHEVVNTRCLACLKEFGPVKLEKEVPPFDAATELRIQQEVQKRVNQASRDRESEKRWEESIKLGFK